MYELQRIQAYLTPLIRYINLKRMDPEETRRQGYCSSGYENEKMCILYQ